MSEENPLLKNVDQLVAEIMAAELSRTQASPDFATAFAAEYDELLTRQKQRRRNRAAEMEKAASELRDSSERLDGVQAALIGELERFRNEYPPRRLRELADIDPVGPIDTNFLARDSNESFESWSEFEATMQDAHQYLERLAQRLFVHKPEWNALAYEVKSAIERGKDLIARLTEDEHAAALELETVRQQEKQDGVAFAAELEALRKKGFAWGPRAFEDFDAWDWRSPALWSQWAPAVGLPRALKIGTYTAPSDPDLAPVPAVVRFPAEGSIVISAESARDAGRAFLSSLILQLIAKTEPGTYHFQFVDPVGLGDTFAPFLHLNEIDDSIILGRVVSQRQEIGKLLDQALIHIETVTQQFLKSSYKTLSDYNVAADATAERFRYLVISDYPQGFDSETASKLKSVMQHGPRCGVHTIVLGKSNTSTSTFNEPLDINSLDANAAYISVGEHHGGSLTCDTDASLTDQRSPTDVAELVGDPWLERGTPARIKLNSRTVSEQRLVGLSVQDVAFCVISSAGSPSIQEAADLLAAVRNSGATTGGLVVVGRTASRDALRISALVPDGSEFRLESATVEICVPSDALADLAAITGAQIVDTVAAVIEDASVVGGCGQVRFSTDELEIQSGRGGIFELRTQRSSIKTAFAEATDSAERLRNAARWEKSIGSAVPEGNVGLARLQYESLAAPALPTLGATLHGKKTEYLKLALDMPPLLRMSDSEDNGLFGQLLMTTARAGTRRESKIVTADDAFAMMMRADARREQQSGEGAQAMLPIPDDPSTWWSMSSKDEIRTPIGRTGAREACCITFDSKMESAAIVIGTTGSGKSTMLHSFILGACMQYPPEELELYLLDSKQGVEFKVYEHLPHARAVAIHNEREFGVSVMRGLREELERRAALIKGATSGGEVGLPGYRDATGDRLPRIVMVADEFHELFEIDDALGREARELLDDLIRQGRSYGIHVFLGSQTLDGAEAMPTHAIGLIQTRIAFACRQQDAEVVMSPQNAEVMSLSGAGDGIFNSQRGTPEANQRFQGSMSTSGERIEIVQQVLNRAVGSWDRRPIVFDGDAPARLDDFPASDFVLAGPSETVRARIGEPCEISGSVTLELARRPGANVVAILEERAGTSFIQCLAAAAHANPSLSMAVIDYLGSEDPVLASVLCDRITHSRRRAGAARIAELAELVFQRIESDDYSSPPRLLVITGLKAMRDIDQIPDQGEPISNLLQKIASDGPEVGVHLILIDDSIRSFERRIDRGLLGEFGIRIVGQMSANDSSNMIESPIAETLRDNQAVLWDDSNGSTQRLRTYEPASATWIDEVMEQGPVYQESNSEGTL